MADVKYKDATPVDEPVARPKQKAKPTAPKKQMQNRYEYREEFMPLTVKRKNSDSEELKSSPVAGLDLTESESNPYNNFNSGPSSYAKGGSASSRADGCAQRGKTKGMMR
jgi:hypothetical protein